VSRAISNPRVLYLKGALFLALGAIAASVVWLQQPGISTFLLLMILAWSAARAYYFAFYVIERYVDPRFRYYGLISLLSYLLRRRTAAAAPASPASPTDPG
jgi:hypothetical protein